MFYSGHGMVGYIKLDFNLKYDDVIRQILKSANDQMNLVGFNKEEKKAEDCFSRLCESEWKVNLYIDACHSGSAKDAGEKLVEELGGELDRKGEDLTACDLYYLDRESYLQIELFTSCTSSQISNDAGEGKGSAWTSKFIAQG
jgi:hypothetical protein